MPTVRLLRLAVILALVAAAPPLAAQEPEKIAQGRRLAHVALGHGVYDTLIDQAASLVVKLAVETILKGVNRELTPSEHDAFVAVVRETYAEVLPIGVWEEAFAPIYAKHLTVSEMTEMLRFYDTDFGQRLISLQSRVLFEGMQAGESLARAHEQQFRERLQDKMQNLASRLSAGPNIATANPGVGPQANAGAPPPGVFLAGKGVTLPRVTREVRPQYTAAAMRAKIEGAVRLECVVAPDGTVSDARVTRSLDSTYGLDEEAIKAARAWRFQPGTRNGEAVPVMVTIELTFTLKKD